MTDTAFATGKEQCPWILRESAEPVKSFVPSPSSMSARTLGVRVGFASHALLQRTASITFRTPNSMRPLSKSGTMKSVGLNAMASQQKSTAKLWTVRGILAPFADLQSRAVRASGTSTIVTEAQSNGENSTNVLIHKLSAVFFVIAATSLSGITKSCSRALVLSAFLPISLVEV